METPSQGNNTEGLVRVAAGALFLDGHLTIPENARGIVLFPYAIENEQRVSYTDGLARDYLPRVGAPVLLLAGENDTQGNESSRQALGQLRGEKKLETISGAGHLFEETSTQEEVVRLASQWFERHLRLG